MVTIKKGSETQTLKYKKAEPLLAQGWELDSSTVNTFSTRKRVLGCLYGIC